MNETRNPEDEGRGHPRELGGPKKPGRSVDSLEAVEGASQRTKRLGTGGVWLTGRPSLGSGGNPRI